MPTAAGILLDMSGMNEVIKLDKENMYVKVQSGCIWKKMMEVCEKEGLLAGHTRPASVCHRCGWISTSGIGPADTSTGCGNSILNMKVVLSNGTVIETVTTTSPTTLSDTTSAASSTAPRTLGIIVR